MAEVDCLDSLVCRRVQYRYRKRAFLFDLSQSLFSSAGVDSGTHLLLATLAEELDLPTYDRFVDYGCGVGTLGIALAGSCGRPLVAIDRDALAIAFTERNARLNGLVDLKSELALTVPDYEDVGRELVLSNLPAKAGAPVLHTMIVGMARRATLSGGESAVVIVRPLAEFLTDELASLSATVLAERRTGNHGVVVFRCSVPPEEEDPVPDLPTEFIRGEVEFEGPSKPYRLDTVYNVPDFDRLSFRLALAFDLLRGNELAGEVLLYGCGQGHLAVGLSQRAPRATLSIADRDLLALRITGHNLRRSGASPATTLAVASIASLAERVAAGSVDWLVIDDDPTPGSAWNREIVDTASALLSSSGKMLVVSRSTSVTRLYREAGSVFAQIADRRLSGFRASTLRLRR